MERQTITFDFDHTLCLCTKSQAFWTESHTPLEIGLEEYRLMKDMGHSVNILTTRKHEDMPEVHDSAEAFNLEPDNIWNTNFEWKGDWLLTQDIHIDRHYDDNPTEFQLLSEIEDFNHMELRIVMSGYGVGAEIADWRDPTKEQRKRILMLQGAHRGSGGYGGWA